MFDSYRDLNLVDASRFDLVLHDIEGTISDIHFVKNVLFPYSSEHLNSYLKTHWAELVPEMAKFESEIKLPGQNELILAQVESVLQTWILQDLKHPLLKYIQGLIWQKGFEDGRFKAHLYADVIPKWKFWLAQNKRLAIYSSGSVFAQRLLFAHTEMGDVRPYLEAYFDLSVGAKKDVESYRKISEQLGLPTSKILFLSDIADELKAAQSAGCGVVLISR